MTSRTDDVTTPICMTVLGDGDHVHATLSYTATDPYAVSLDFHQLDERGEPVVWVFGRDLIATVVRKRRRAGEADVQLYELDAVTVVIALRSPDGAMALTMSADDLTCFLRETEAVVPTGAEADHLGLDAALAELLGASDGR